MGLSPIMIYLVPKTNTNTFRFHCLTFPSCYLSYPTFIVAIQWTRNQCIYVQHKTCISIRVYREMYVAKSESGTIDCIYHINTSWIQLYIHIMQHRISFQKPHKCPFAISRVFIIRHLKKPTISYISSLLWILLQRLNGLELTCLCLMTVIHVTK